MELAYRVSSERGSVWQEDLMQTPSSRYNQCSFELRVVEIQTNLRASD